MEIPKVRGGLTDPVGYFVLSGTKARQFTALLKKTV